MRSYPASPCLIHTQWQQPAFVGGFWHQCVTLEIWTWSLPRPGVKAISSTPPPVNYWSSVTGAQCPRPVMVKDEGVLALSNEPSVEMPATNDPCAETHLSSARAIGSNGMTVCLCIWRHCVYLTLNTLHPSLAIHIFPFSSREKGLGVAQNNFLLPADRNVIRPVCLV